jgi:hypothetical protein
VIRSNAHRSHGMWCLYAIDEAGSEECIAIVARRYAPNLHPPVVARRHQSGRMILAIAVRISRDISATFIGHRNPANAVPFFMAAGSHLSL